MEEVPLCPDWWPLSLWRLHFTKFPWPHGPINLPFDMASILSALQTHTQSYFLIDQELGKQVRAAAVKSIVETVQHMDERHEQAIKGKSH